MKYLLVWPIAWGKSIWSAITYPDGDELTTRAWVLGLVALVAFLLQLLIALSFEQPGWDNLAILWLVGALLQFISDNGGPSEPTLDVVDALNSLIIGVVLANVIVSPLKIILVAAM